MADRMEVVCDGVCVFAGETSHSPEPGELINIRKLTYQVLGRTFTVDYVDERHVQVVCYLNVERRPNRDRG